MSRAVIKFHLPRGPYGEFSNFYVRPIVVENLNWPVGTAQFYQAMKLANDDAQEHVRTKLSQPGQVRSYCSQQTQLRADWEDSVSGLSPKALETFTDDSGLVVNLVKDHFMYTALIAKFTQHKDLAKILIDTDDSLLIEDTRSNFYWGNGSFGNGLNKLGRMLMLVRKSLVR
jgi:predicted NAD-dependent protein-ADP-ribosyltransferase YbiA (DUF1768 family)